MIGILNKNNEMDFDNARGFSSNEAYYTFNLLGHMNLSKDKESNQIMTDDDNDMPSILSNFLYLNSNDVDSNEQSKELFNSYRQQYMK